MNYHLEDYFCIYIDILGFSNRLKKAENNNQLTNELNYFINYVGFENDFWKELSKISDFHFRIFSDNIFIALPYKNDTINIFHSILDEIISYQESLIRINYFIRGGITIGKLYISNDDNTIFGTGLIDAVAIEKEANYPFVCLSKKILELYNKYDLFCDDNGSFCIPLIKMQNDKYFLDYLYTTFFRGNTPPIASGFLDKHKYWIQYNINNNNDDKIVSKYVLLGKYHNNFCEKYKKEFPQLNKYVIKIIFDSEGTNFERKFIKYLP